MLRVGKNTLPQGRVHQLLLCNSKLSALKMCIHTSTIIQSKQILMTYLGIYRCIQIRVTIKLKEAMNLKEDREREVWMEERERGNNIIIILKIQRNTLKKKTRS